MSSIFGPGVEDKIKAMGDVGITKIQELLKAKEVGASEGWQKSVYALLASSVSTYGPMGIDKALGAMQNMLDGKEPNFDWSTVDLEVASNILARMQNQEALENTANRAFMTKVVESVKVIAQVVLASI